MGLVNKWANYGKWRHSKKRKELLENKVMNTLDTVYQNLLETLINHGIEKDTRNGKTRSIFGYQIRHDMQEGFPLLTTKKMFWKGIVTELLWFLRGDTNIKYLVDNDCHIWTGDAFRNYINTYKGNFELDKEEFINAIKTSPEFAKKWGELGPVYGRQWRAFDEDASGGIDQIANLINDLKTNPDSRRMLVTAWNPTYLPHCVLPPCHYGFQVYTRELSQEELRSRYPKLKEIYDIKSMCIKNMEYENAAKARDVEKQIIETLPTRAISLMWNQRSVDTFLGLPFNIASYGLLLTMIADEVNMVPDELIGNLGDVHLYENHIEQAKEQCSREPFELPKLIINDEFWNPDAGIIEQIPHIEPHDFIINRYQSHPTIKAPLSN